MVGLAAGLVAGEGRRNALRCKKEGGSGGSADGWTDGTYFSNLFAFAPVHSASVEGASFSPIAWFWRRQEGVGGCGFFGVELCLGALVAGDNGWVVVDGFGDGSGDWIDDRCGRRLID